MKVFLGGTCADSKWRDIIIPKLKCDYFNPVVDDWTPECQKIEEEEKNKSSHHLYVITPKMKGVFSIAEAVNDSTIDHITTIFCVTKEDDDRDWTEGERRSLEATAKLIENNGGIICHNLDDVVEELNRDVYDEVCRERDYYKKRTEHLSRLYRDLVDEILPEGWYSMSMDTWGCEEDEFKACKERLNRPRVQKIIKKEKF